MICTVHAVLRKSGSSPRWLWMMFCRSPTSDSKCSSTETVVAMTITPNISGSSKRAMIRLPPRRMTCDATCDTRFHDPALMAR
ncbi:hypothetical protein DBADOPDK_03252 [Pseudomonas sp. MM223]|nr:hypothetical protein DBADOPDK_03252 [Pseudomonas sp. MM223]